MRQEQEKPVSTEQITTNIKIRDNLEIPTKFGSVDILVNKEALSQDLLSGAKEKYSIPVEGAQEILNNTAIFFGNKPLFKTVEEYHFERYINLGLSGSKALSWAIRERINFTIKYFLESLGQIEPLALYQRYRDYSRDYSFFYFNVPEIASAASNPEELVKGLGHSWRHEREHFIQTLDPTEYEKQARKQIRWAKEAALVTLGGTSLCCISSIIGTISKDPMVICTGGMVFLAGPMGGVWWYLSRHLKGTRKAEEEAKSVATQKDHSDIPFSEIFEVRLESKPILPNS